MGDVPFQFNASQYQPGFASGAGGLPVGKHPVYINDAKWTPTKAGDGSTMLVLTAEAYDGAAKGQSQEIRLNVQNASALASRIAYQQLAAICVVCGQPQGIMQAASEIFNKPFILEIALQRETEANKGKGYTEPVNVYFLDGRDCNGQAPKAPLPAPQPQPQAQQQPGPAAFAQQQPQPQPQPGAFAPPQGFAQPQGGFAPPPPAPFGGMPGGAQMMPPPANPNPGMPWGQR